jgi:hypothetical protein
LLWCSSRAASTTHRSTRRGRTHSGIADAASLYPVTVPQLTRPPSRRDREDPLGSRLPRGNADELASAAEIAPRRPAAVESARVSRASLLVGAFGLLSALFVLARLLESWRVSEHAAAHRISILGQGLTYPTANAGAIVMLLLALLGLVVTGLAVYRAGRELLAARRFNRRLAELNPRPLGDALVIDDRRPRAFCAGLIAPRIYISSGALELLDASGLEAVLAHERHHARRRDPLRLAATRVLARALYLLPGWAELVQRQQALTELSADESAIDAAPENRAGLAAAMLSFSDAPVSDPLAGVDPVRVDYLLGEPPDWRFPLGLCLACAGVIALLVAIAVLAGQVAQGSATLAAPFLSAQPCVLVLASIPATLGLITAVYVRRQDPRRVRS